MPLPALLSFHTVARQGGISAAASHLGLAKSGVSRHVALLEDHFGVRLLERGARSVRLTPVGQRLDDRIQSILAEIDLLDEIAREEQGGIKGQVTIAATPEFGGLIAKEIFPEIRARHPDLMLVMRPAYAFEDMQDPGTDLAFRVGSFKDDRLVARRLGRFHRWLVASPHLLDAYPIAEPEDLAKAPCLTFRGDRPGATWTLTRGEQRRQVDVAGPIAVRSFSILFDLACAGEGVAALPQFILTDALNRGTLLRVLPEYELPASAVYLTFRPGARNIARVRAVIEMIEEMVPPHLPTTA